MDNQRLHFLLEKQENQTINSVEQQEIEEFYQSFEKQPNFTDSVANLNEYEQLSALRMSAAIDKHLLKRKNPSIKLKYWVASAAAVILLSVGLYIGLKPTSDAFHTVSTKNGEIKTVQLPDGSKVTLNAASSLKYPVNFIKEKERVVELSGEAYFEVSKDKKHPFLVKTTHQMLKVLGTRFNIKAYRDETSTITTLFEGSIKIFSLSTTAIETKIEREKTLLPGQKAILKNDMFIITVAQTDNVLAWKNGVFCFDREPFQSVMNKISRWYDVDIVYLDDLDTVENYEEFFYGRVSKSVDLKRVLAIIEIAAPVQFTVKADKVIVKLRK